VTEESLATVSDSLDSLTALEDSIATEQNLATVSDSLDSIYSLESDIAT
jgi:hypothetical protein